MGLALGLLLAGTLAAWSAAAQDYAGFGNAGSDSGLFGIFDEVRGGTAFSIDKNDDTGLLVSGMLFFRSFVPPQQNYFANTLLRPRPFIGGNLAVEDDGISQVYGGLTWNFPVFGPLFIEASFGGTWHNGPQETIGDGPDLGCSVLFHEGSGSASMWGSTGASSARRTTPRMPAFATAAIPASPMPAPMWAIVSEVHATA